MRDLLVPSDLRLVLVLYDLKSRAEVEAYCFLARELMVMVSRAYELLEEDFTLLGFFA